MLILPYYLQCFLLPSVLWHCWLGGRKGIQPVKNWVVGFWHGYLSAARCRRIWPSWCHCHSLSLASVKSRLVLPFWYRLTRVVPEKGPLNGCVCVFVLLIETKLLLIFQACYVFSNTSTVSQEISLGNLITINSWIIEATVHKASSNAATLQVLHLQAQAKTTQTKL